MEKKGKHKRCRRRCRLNRVNNSILSEKGRNSIMWFSKKADRAGGVIQTFNEKRIYFRRRPQFRILSRPEVAELLEDLRTIVHLKWQMRQPKPAGYGKRIVGYPCPRDSSQESPRRYFPFLISLGCWANLSAKKAKIQTNHWLSWCCDVWERVFSIMPSIHLFSVFIPAIQAGW
jgi:hypothetical protein